MVFVAVTGQVYKSKREYFIHFFPERTDASQNEIDSWFYHNSIEYRKKKQCANRERYRTKKEGNVRAYNKFVPESTNKDNEPV